MAIRYSRAAEADLFEIYRYGLEHFGRYQVEAYRKMLDRSLRLIAANPFLARLRTEIVPPVRLHRSGAHVVVYSVDENADVLILRVRHGREDWLNDPLG